MSTLRTILAEEGLIKTADISDDISDEWGHAYLRWWDNSIEGLLGANTDRRGTLKADLNEAITGHTGYPRSGRKAVAKVLADFERKVLSAMDSWDKQQRSIGVEFHE
jgi:hypothetical protein